MQLLFLRHLWCVARGERKRIPGETPGMAIRQSAAQPEFRWTLAASEPWKLQITRCRILIFGGFQIYISYFRIFLDSTWDILKYLLIYFDYDSIIFWGLGAWFLMHFRNLKPGEATRCEDTAPLRHYPGGIAHYYREVMTEILKISHKSVWTWGTWKSGWSYLFSGWWCNNHLEKYESRWEGLSMIIPYIMENKKCVKPPTSYFYLFLAGIEHGSLVCERCTKLIWTFTLAVSWHPHQIT